MLLIRRLRKINKRTLKHTTIVGTTVKSASMYPDYGIGPLRFYGSEFRYISKNMADTVFGKGVYNLNSDTVTQPTALMRQAMRDAEVGDDVSLEDPTVTLLEQRIAEYFGKEAAVFVPSGTMGNLIAVLTHCRERGSEFIVGDEAHIYYYEQGGAASLGGCHPRVLPNNDDGTIELTAIQESIREEDDHYPVTKLLCLENTHNRKGGAILSPEYIQEAAALCKKHNIKLHIDGARLANAIAELDIDPIEYTKGVDSISYCLSKGIGAPVGSLVVGTQDFIYHARRLRKALGGGMRQVGVLAAPALVALDTILPLLQLDHVKARKFAQGISEMDGINVNLDSVQTNIVFFDVVSMDSNNFTQACSEKGLKMGSYGSSKTRAVFHHHICVDSIPRILEIISTVLDDNK
eukprot:TRINITY_DN12214_c0_g1_i1.p1 TRINITY_DN12214_c0_g1~~TRINITY_DN12214_c0_g1_i1.p1  ORF type:complete len:406 (+),score=75.89 TRINITY_DN12214_c0_g1_i1:281-1498(+)